MPDTQCIALGGGSIVHFLEDGRVQIGPQSVGYKLKTEAKCFGGNTLTATDLAVAAGLADAYIPEAKKESIGLTT